jgi:bifunctional non-homologous end joining protein LigD
MRLADYKKKRRFHKTPEPGPEAHRSKSGRLFVVQKHRASHLHYDFRLESDGVLKSWAVPKGPSVDPGVKRLAMQVEDHPVNYANFEGIIPEGEYGGGTVMVWDQGTYVPENGENLSAAIRKGEVKFTLKGQKLSGSWALVRTRAHQWLLIKHRDKAASTEEITETKPLSVLSKRTLAEIAADNGGNIKKAATGDPKSAGQQKRKVPTKRSKSPAVWHSNQGKANVARVTIPGGARKGAMPSSIKPMLATLVDNSFDDADWLFEAKWDGVRAICFLKDGKLSFVSRNQQEMTRQYPELNDIATNLDAETAILDGEIVALDNLGVPRFQLLQPRFGRKRAVTSTKGFSIAYYVFDLLYYNGHNLMGCSLIERKALLKQILNASAELRFSDHVIGQGKGFFQQIERLKLEGMIAKRVDSHYVQRRGSDWLKVKTISRQEVVIGGYTEPRRSRSHFGALVVGLYEGRELRYVGHTGGGFDRENLAAVYKRLQQLKTDRCPFAVEPKTNEAVQWVKPKLVCEVKFSEWTNDFIMRHPIFMGLREDREPRQCRVEMEHSTRAEIKQAKALDRAANRTEKVQRSSALHGELRGDMSVKIGRHTARLTNLDKVYWPKDGYTKGDLIRYYFEIGKTILSYYKDRPLILKRYPNGIDSEPFHQHSLDNPPTFVKTYSRSKEGDSVLYGIANNLETLVYLANLGSISLHPWASHISRPHKPDWIIFDVDPGSANFETVCDVALEVKIVLDELGLESFPKTSGSKGMHVYVPIKPDYIYDQVVPFANLVAAFVERKRPDIVSIARIVAKRKKGRVYLDYLQNGFGKSVAGPYSVRARPGATVSAPLEWNEVKRKKIRPQDFTIETIFERLEQKGDLFAPLLTRRQSLAHAVRRMADLVGGVD